MDPPQNPAGEFAPETSCDAQQRDAFIRVIEQAPAILRATVTGLSPQQLETRYRNWTIRQIVHHLADSHVHSYIRFKWTLTEERPTIKAYEESDWAALDDSRTGDIEPPLRLHEGLHACWVQLLRTMTDQQFAREFIHPQSGETIRLSMALQYYAWHCQHHTAQIRWRREQEGW